MSTICAGTAEANRQASHADAISQPCLRQQTAEDRSEGKRKAKEVSSLKFE